MNIAVFHGGPGFVKPLVEDWRMKGHNVRVNPNYSVWPNFKPDILHFEMCTSNLVQFTSKWAKIHGKPDKVYCRLHGVGVRLSVYKNVDWTLVDDAIFVSPWLWDQCKDFDGWKNTRTHIINNGIDLTKFTLKKSFDPTYKVAFVGKKNMNKGYDLLPEIMSKFNEIDARYTLHGAFGEIKDMNAWLEDKDYLIHPSRYESFCCAVGEALAKGIRPLIGRWAGAERIWGNEFFLDDFNLKQEPERFRQMIKHNYNAERMVAKINKVMGL